MYNHKKDQLFNNEATCGSLISELQKMWDEVGEPDIERDKMLHELEQECLEAYRKKVDQASQRRAKLRQAIADSEAELAHIYSILGERPAHGTQNAGCLKKEVETVMPYLEEMRRRKSERRIQFVEVLDQTQDIAKELYLNDCNHYKMDINESDLSLKRLEDLQSQLVFLQKEKNDRLKLVCDHLNILKSLCLVLGMDYKHTIRNIDPFLDDTSGSKNINTNSMEKLSTALYNLKEVKIQRMQKLKDLAGIMIELWNLMDIPAEEKEKFRNIMSNVTMVESEITEPNALSMDSINSVESEILRLQEMKSIKMKEVILRKRLQLVATLQRAHMVAKSHMGVNYSEEAVESGAIDPSFLLEQLEHQISNANDEALNRKDILDKVEKWMAAQEEESWLEEYNRDENRYNAGRGAHLILKRAEKARVLVSKIPAMVDALTLRASVWEKERGSEFLYDGVPLFSMLEQYNSLRHEKEQERRRQRDQRKLQVQLMAEQEALFGSKPSPSKGGKSVYRTPINRASNKRFSLGGVMLQTPNVEKTSASKCKAVKQQNGGFMACSSGAKPKWEAIGQPEKTHTSYSSNSRDVKSTVRRKPLSPISSALYSNTANTPCIQAQDGADNGFLQKAVPINRSPVVTPTKNIANADVNKTPITLQIRTPGSPSTLSTAMQTTSTPANFCALHGGYDDENSFEESRAIFYLSEAHEESKV